MADPFATPGDLELVWRALTAEEMVRATKLLIYASAEIRNQFPTIDDRITAGTLDALVAESVAVSMVQRVLLNPDGYRSVQEGIEDYTTTRTRDSALSTGQLYLTDEERERLSRRGSAAFSITPTAAPTTYADCERIAVNRAGWGRCR